MITVRQEYAQRKRDIETYYEFMDDIMIKNADKIFNGGDINTLEHIDLDTQSIMRSSFFLMLYNCVESTVTNCLTAICNAIRNDRCCYSDLIDEVQLTIVDSYEYLIMNQDNRQNHISSIQQGIGVFCYNQPVPLSFSQYIHSSSQGTYSGSLDVREIRKLFAHFGINLDDLSCNEMVKIRDKRNQLGHGEVSFRECSNDSTIQYLKNAKDKMFSFFDEVILRVGDYITQKKYRR